MADIVGTESDDTLVGTADADTIRGLGGDDSLSGGGGDDVIDGGSGLDRMRGGLGNDLFRVDNAQDIVFELAGEGSDTVRASVSYALTAGAYVELVATASEAGTTAQNLSGNELNQTVWGNAGANILDGGAGDDFLEGFAGNDVLIGGTGADYMVGGAADDVYYVDDLGDKPIEFRNGGLDFVRASVSYVLTPGTFVETLQTIDDAATTAINLTGNELANSIFGNAGNNVLDGGDGNDGLSGGAGNDVLIGGPGADGMNGGFGDDIYIVDDLGDRANETTFGTDGNDTVYTSVNFTLNFTSIENLIASDAASTNPLTLTGSSVANFIVGNAGANFLDGLAGADTLVGGAGDDTYLVDNVADQVVEAVGGGFDSVRANLNYVLLASSEVELLITANVAGTTAINFTGSATANRIDGNAGANILDGAAGNDVLIGYGGNDILIGGAGADVMEGGAGDDVYLVDNAGDVVNEISGEGFDVVRASASFTLSAGSYVDVLSTNDVAGTAAINLAGNETRNVLEGNAGANILNGGGGDDAINGFGGNDELTGGTGADSFVFTTALNAASNVDVVRDFDVSADRIVLGGRTGEPFQGLAFGALSASAFVTGAAAADADDRIIYNPTTGALLFDADGSGAGAAVQFATLGTGLALTAANFIIG